MDGRTDGQKARQTEGLNTEKNTDRLTDKETEGRMARRAVRETDILRKADRQKKL